MNNLQNIQKQTQYIQELNDEEINQISGGHVLIIAAGVAAAFGALTAAESFGQRVGKGIYYLTH